LVLRPQFFQILKTVQGQDQDRFGQNQDQDLKKKVLRTRPILRTTSLGGHLPSCPSVSYATVHHHQIKSGTNGLNAYIARKFIA